MERMTRRRFLGATGTVGAAGLAGCGNEASNEPTDDLDGSEYTGVDEWLGGDEVGGPSSNYEGTITDARNNPQFTITVGAEGNGGYNAFDPAGVIVSMGTTVRWEWSDEGGAHNVVSDPDEQLGHSNMEFSSGEPQENREMFHQSSGGIGTAFYKCENHLDAGMKGVVIWR